MGDSTISKILHFFVPQPSNNHHAKALHFSSLTIYITLLIVFQIFLTAVQNFHPEVLGFASNISVEDLLSSTNAKRAAVSVAPLALNPQLSAAAQGKANDMFLNQYWAHVSPQGKDPWAFIIAAGYNYIFAGENLARDFGDSNSVVEAWMNSPAHRDNLLNSRFKDVGYAVVNGKFGNEETTLVVQMFGSKTSSSPSVETKKSGPKNTEALKIETQKTASPSPLKNSTPSASGQSNQQMAPKPPAPPQGKILNINQQTKKSSLRLDVLDLTKNVTTGALLVLIVILIIDSAFIYRQKAVRLTGHNFAHLVLLLAVLAVMNLLGRGTII